MDTMEAETIAEETRLPVDIDAQPVVQAAAALQPVIRTYHEEIEREQRMPKALVEQLRAAGFSRVVIPRTSNAQLTPHHKATRPPREKTERSTGEGVWVAAARVRAAIIFFSIDGASGENRGQY